MSDKNEVFEYLIDQLRQQVNNNQCEDLAHEVQSLKNRLRDASAQIKELQGDNIEKSRHISRLMGQSSAYHSDALRFQAQVEDLVKRLAKATGDVRGHIDATEQSGRRKEDVRLPVCRCVPAHCGTYHGNTIVCDNCGGVIPE